MTYLKITKEKLTALESKSSDLMNENQRLKIRAASAWEELTPRPDLSRIIQALGNDPITYQGFGSKQLANELIGMVNRKISNLTSNSTVSLSPPLVIQRTKSKKERSYTYLEKPKIRAKTYINKRNSTSNEDSEENNILENDHEEIKENRDILKKNTLSIVDELVKAGINKVDNIERISPKSFVTAKRNMLMNFEKNMEGIKIRSFSPHHHHHKENK